MNTWKDCTENKPTTSFPDVGRTALSYVQCFLNLRREHLSGKQIILTPCGLVTPIWHQSSLVNIGSGNGLLPDGTKSLPEPILTDHH